jgi:hypothetical protein
MSNLHNIETILLHAQNHCTIYPCLPNKNDMHISNLEPSFTHPKVPKNLTSTITEITHPNARLTRIQLAEDHL